MNNWYKKLKKAPWSPPNYLFGIVWPILYTMMSVAFFLVWKSNACFPYCSALTTFFIQLAFNLSWTTIFFYYKMPKVALLDILLILFFSFKTYTSFLKVNTTAAYLLIPYLAWLLLAFSLNLYIVLYN